MGIVKVKKLIEDLEQNSSFVVGSVTKLTSQATYATTAGNAGTARVAHFASSGTAALAGTSAVWSTGGL